MSRLANAKLENIMCKQTSMFSNARCFDSLEVTLGTVVLFDWIRAFGIISPVHFTSFHDVFYLNHQDKIYYVSYFFQVFKF